MANMLTEVSQAFNLLSEKYPHLKNILDRCYNEIRNSEKDKESADELQAQKKQKVKHVLESSINMRPLTTTFDGLLTVTANNEDQLIDVLKRLTEAQAQDKKKILSFAARQGLLLKEAKERSKATMYKHVRNSCEFSSSYANFLIALYRLFEKYPRLNYCSVAIRFFCSNMKLIQKICHENQVFWSNLS
ncbi:hypothetical protein OS493_039597 [Desmophyllum pertusum]|uniref:Uncharacterized protein n=1 Tax=Desmophyllum pertusum TaxID=174260 RepID=A0A9W9Y6Q9_9CNID|nr:hypothetical protein OS493_039597 [Desmophyllum pertusum]